MRYQATSSPAVNKSKNHCRAASARGRPAGPREAARERSNRFLVQFLHEQELQTKAPFSTIHQRANYRWALATCLSSDAATCVIVAPARRSTADDVVQACTDDCEPLVLAASGVRIDGAAGLAWAAADASAVVRSKYRMMCAMLKDASRNCSYARAIERAVRAALARTGECVVLDIGTGFGTSATV